MIQIKNAAELAQMRRACEISAAALKAGGEAIEPGISDGGDRQNHLRLYRAARRTAQFPASVRVPGHCLHQRQRHGHPRHSSRSQKIRPGDIVSIDTGCKIGGFNGDNACTYACGKVDLEARRLMEVTKESLHRGIAMAQAGNRIGDISHAVQSYVEENGFSVVRSFVGHGVGKELHEDPEVPNFGNPGRGPRPGARHDHRH